MSWYSEPLYYVVYNIVSTSKTKMIKEEDLLNMVRYIFPEVSINDLIKALMILEIRGLIAVSQIKDKERVIRVLR